MENLKMDHILKIMEQFEKTSIDTLKYKNDGEEILLTKNKNGKAVKVSKKDEKNITQMTEEQESQEETSIQQTNNKNPEETTPTTDVPADKKEENNLISVESPIIGTFYASPTPGKPPFVQKGDKIKKGDVLCIIEAMKVMNKIESEHNGVIAEICMEDGQPVEYGSCLFKIKPD
mgnify:CR=1 FL=1